jgi:hypothetical protein
LSHPGTFTRGFECVATDDLPRLERCITKFVWSPIRFKDGVRRQANFEAANWCALDFETPDLTLEAAQALFIDRTHLIGTTRNHRKAKGDLPPLDRFRVVMRWERPITDLRLYRWNMRRMTDRYPCDVACRDGARFFFPCRQVTQMEVEGLLEEVDTHIPAWFDAELHPEFQAAAADAGLLPSWVTWALRVVIPVGQRNPTIYRMAKDLSKYGLDEEAIVAIVVGGKTYGGQEKVDKTVLAEIRKTVRSAANRAREDGYGGRSTKR